MPDENIIRVKNELYLRAKDLAKSEGISLADAVGKLVEKGDLQPSACELTQFQRVLEARGLTPPKQAGWVWSVTEALPPEVLAGSKLEPYAQARTEAELRCTLGDELYDKLIGDLGSVGAVEQALDGAIAESAEQSEPAVLTSFEKLEGEAGVEASASPEAETAEQSEVEPVEATKEV